MRFCFGLYYLVPFFLMSNGVHAENITTKDVVFSSPETTKGVISTLSDHDVMIVSFKFNPYDQSLLEKYLPDGYITINGEYDVTELISKIYFYPLIDENNIQFLVIDLDSFLKKPSKKNVLNIKALIDNLAEYIYKKGKSVNLGLRFTYDLNRQPFFESLFSYTSVQLNVSGLSLGSGYMDFFRSLSFKGFVDRLKYLNLSNNIIGSEYQNYTLFLESLSLMKNIEILDLDNNIIGILDGNLKSFGNKIIKLNKLKYLSLENNLIGIYKKDTKEFQDLMKQKKDLNVNLNYNVDL